MSKEPDPWQALGDAAGNLQQELDSWRRLVHGARAIDYLNRAAAARGKTVAMLTVNLVLNLACDHRVDEIMGDGIDTPS